VDTRHLCKITLLLTINNGKLWQIIDKNFLCQIMKQGHI